MLKQATLTDLYNGQKTPKGKQEKITTTSKETKQEEQEITEKIENKNNKLNTNNTNKKHPNNIGEKTRKQTVVLRKPILPEPKNSSIKKPTEEKPATETKITNYFTRNQQKAPPEQKPRPKLPNKETKTTIKAKPPKPKKPKPDSSTNKKTKNSEYEKTKKIEQTREKARGYWLKLAENQKIKKNRQQAP